MEEGRVPTGTSPAAGMTRAGMGFPGLQGRGLGGPLFPTLFLFPSPSRSKRGVKPWGPQGPRSKGGVRSALSTSQSPVPSFPSPPSPGSGSGAPGPEGPFQGCLLRPCLWRGATEAWQAALRIVRLSCVPAKRLLVLDAEWRRHPHLGARKARPQQRRGTAWAPDRQAAWVQRQASRARLPPTVYCAIGKVG